MKICDYLKIDNLPAIDGRHFFRSDGVSFTQHELLPEHKLFVNNRLFDDYVLQQFAANRHDVLFVFEEDALRGVVHLCDYNRDIVLQCIQDDILSFERKLRHLILLHGFRNDDMRSYFAYKRDKTSKGNDKTFYQAKIDSYDRRSAEIDTLGYFQSFDFSDLLNFASSEFTQCIFKAKPYTYDGIQRSGGDILRELRNIAMHGKNPVAINKETSVYSIDSLKKLSQSLAVLRAEYAAVFNKIRQHPDYLRSIVLENRNKLEIIQDHELKALEYFLGF